MTTAQFAPADIVQAPGCSLKTNSALLQTLNVRSDELQRSTIESGQTVIKVTAHLKSGLIVATIFVELAPQPPPSDGKVFSMQGLT